MQVNETSVLKLNARESIPYSFSKDAKLPIGR